MARAKRYYTSGSRTPLHVAAENGHVEVVRALLENAGTDMEIIDAYDDYESTALLKAVAKDKNSVRIIQMLLEAGADPNVEDEGFSVPLHRAVDIGNTEAVQVLVADPRTDLDKNKTYYNDDRTHHENLTALDLALKKGQSEIAAIISTEIERRKDPAAHARYSPMRDAWMSYGAITIKEAEKAVAKLSSNYGRTLLLEDAKPDHTLG